jgi:hypothetical protein
VAPDVLAGSSVKLKALLGFQPWGTLGSVEGNGIQAGFRGSADGLGLVQRPALPIGELSAASPAEVLRQPFSFRSTEYHQKLQGRVRRNERLARELEVGRAKL